LEQTLDELSSRIKLQRSEARLEELLEIERVKPEEAEAEFVEQLKFAVESVGEQKQDLLTQELQNLIRTGREQKIGAIARLDQLIQNRVAAQFGIPEVGTTYSNNGVLVTTWAVETEAELQAVVDQLPQGGTISFSVPEAQLASANRIYSQARAEVRDKITLSRLSLAQLVQDEIRKANIDSQLARQVSVPSQYARTFAVPLAREAARLLEQYELIVLAPEDSVTPGLKTISISEAFLQDLIVQWYQQLEAQEAHARAA
ncbi:MAG TPA: hypothetical protein VJA00_02995, partial [Candidatus Omnitrophota bacterium]|nr:hypothetical protein [Candidatus Omnitrophota bacterium]